MKIGLVKFLNARPLDYGLRLEAAQSGKPTLIEDIPSRLAKRLLRRELDVALISSVEFLRHQDTLSMVPDMGVCTFDKADSLLYIRPKLSKKKPPAWETVHTIYADHGSRSTIALLRLLYQRHTNDMPNIIEAAPEQILQTMPQNCGGLLIGDAALHFQHSSMARDYWSYDLASWWHSEENLPFVFAVWAYHKGEKLNTKIFEDSLAQGLAKLDEIVNEAKEAKNLPNAKVYLSQVLHYQFSQKEKEALRRFEKECRKYGIL